MQLFSLGFGVGTKATSPFLCSPPCLMRKSSSVSCYVESKLHGNDSIAREILWNQTLNITASSQQDSRDRCVQKIPLMERKGNTFGNVMALTAWYHKTFECLRFHTRRGVIQVCVWFYALTSWPRNACMTSEKGKCCKATLMQTSHLNSISLCVLGLFLMTWTKLKPLHYTGSLNAKWWSVSRRTHTHISGQPEHDARVELPSSTGA